MNHSIKEEISLKYAVRCNRGLRRENNEDSYLILTEKHRALFAVADGMGGAKGGEVASQLAVKTLENAMSPIKTRSDKLLFAVRAANSRIYETAKENPEYEGMGTTLSLMVADRKLLTAAHVGDSRIYRFRDDELVQLTEDHSYVWELVKHGAISPEMAEKHPYRNMITRAVGTDAHVEADLIGDKAHKGDRYLLCSDGLTSMVGSREIAAILKDGQGTEETAEALLQAALNAGGYDNVTIILVDFREEDNV